MKTTILFYGRGEGKTTDLIKKVCDTSLSDSILVLAMNNNEAKRLLTTYPEIDLGQIKVTTFQARAIVQSLRGFNPDHIFIDNANFLTSDAIKEIRMLFDNATTLTVTGSNHDNGFIRYKLPELLLGVKEDE